MRAYSPSQTANFMENPVVRDIKKQGWTPSTVGWPQLALTAGGAYQAGISSYYNARKVEKPLGGLATIDWAVAAARKALDDELTQLRTKGVTWKEDVYPQVIALPDTMEKTMRKGFLTDPIPPSWEILEVEPYWTDLGWCKPDLVVKTDTGKVFPIDAKYKRQMDTDRLAQTLSEYMYSWQFMHYSWATCQKYGMDFLEDPSTTHGLLLSVSRPHRVETHYFPVDPVLKRLWWMSAQSVWAVMAAMDGEPQDLLKLVNVDRVDASAGPYEPLPPWHTFLFHGRYGLDPYGEAVLYHKLDPYLMAQSYINTKATGQEPGAVEVKK